MLCRRDEVHPPFPLTSRHYMPLRAGRCLCPMAAASCLQNSLVHVPLRQAQGCTQAAIHWATATQCCHTRCCWKAWRCGQQAGKRWRQRWKVWWIWQVVQLTGHIPTQMWRHVTLLCCVRGGQGSSGLCMLADDANGLRCCIAAKYLLASTMQ